MAELARANGILVVFSSVLPVHSYTEKSKNSVARHSPANILALNEWLMDYCNKNGLIYLDYFGAMVDDRGWLKKELSDDGLHPNAAGYKVMAPLAEAAIAAAMKQSM
jgi:lysophospholipase L1-like esterase